MRPVMLIPVTMVVVAIVMMTSGGGALAAPHLKGQVRWLAGLYVRAESRRNVRTRGACVDGAFWHGEGGRLSTREED